MSTVLAATTNNTSIDTSILMGQVSQSIIKDVERNCKAFADFAQAAGLDTLSKETFAKWRQHLVNETDYTVRTINKKLSHVRMYIRAGHELGHVDDVVLAGFEAVRSLKATIQKERTSKGKAQRVALSQDNVKVIIDQCNTNKATGLMHKALLTSFATCGMRASEMCQLRQDQIIWDVDSETGKGGWMIVCSGGKNKTEDDQELIALAPSAKVAIDEWLTARSERGIDSEFVFTGSAGRGDRLTDKAISRQSAWQVVSKYAKAAGIDKAIKPHDLRRYVGTALAKENIRDAQKQLRHKSITTTAQNYELSGTKVGLTDGLL